MTILLSCILSLFVLAPLSKAPISRNGIVRISQDAEQTFSIQNQTSVNVGMAEILLADASSANINVTPSYTFSVSISSAPTGCSIHSQLVAPNNPSRIVIDAHTAVRATWTGNVIVIDNSENW